MKLVEAVKMGNCKRVVVFLSLSTALSSSVPAPALSEDEGLQRFLDNALTEFPNWLRSNNLDPLPVEAVDLTVVVTNYVNVTGEISDQRLTGHSNVTEFVTSQNFTARNIWLVVPMKNYTVEGVYKLQGLAYNTSIDAGGQFHFEAENEYEFQSYFMLGIFGFGITPDGYINLSAAEKTTAWFGSLGGRVDFSGLDAGGYESWLKYDLKERIDEQWNIWFPVPDLLYQYMDNLFGVTPISEIINATETHGAHFPFR